MTHVWTGNLLSLGPYPVNQTNSRKDKNWAELLGYSNDIRGKKIGHCKENQTKTLRTEPEGEVKCPLVYSRNKVVIIKQHWDLLGSQPRRGPHAHEITRAATGSRWNTARTLQTKCLCNTCPPWTAHHTWEWSLQPRTTVSSWLLKSPHLTFKPCLAVRCGGTYLQSQHTHHCNS